MALPRAAGVPPAHRPAVPLGEPRLRLVRRFHGGAGGAQAQGHPPRAARRPAARRDRALVTGSDLTEAAWDAFFSFYMQTGSRKWGRPYLTRTFFSIVGERMRDHALLVMAKRAGRFIAGALNFIGSDTLFGRNWGAIEHHPFLHFELCYYQAIDFA